MTATPNTAALNALLERVEAGDDKAPFWKVWLPENKDGPLAFVAHRAYHGSLDAAKALHDAVLPGWDWAVGPSNAEVWADRTPRIFTAKSNSNPARTWLIAVLRAMISDTEGR